MIESAADDFGIKVQGRLLERIQAIQRAQSNIPKLQVRVRYVFYLLEV